MVARPIQAAMTSALTFSLGALMPLMITYLSPSSLIAPMVVGGSLVFLAALGALGASVGGDSILKPTIRVRFWGAFAMATTAAIGSRVGHVV